MLVTIIIGGVAGWGAGFVEEHVRKYLAKALNIEEAAFKPVELRSITLAVALFLGALAAWILAVPNAVALTFGAVIGVLLPRLKDLLKTVRSPDYDS